MPSPAIPDASATASPDPAASARRIVDRDILRLALPSLGALIAQPLFVLTDSAFVAHVSTDALAGLGLASTIVTTVVSLSVFLAYSTTAAVARAFGAGRLREAIARGVDACWLAVLIGVGAAVLLLTLGGPILQLFGPSPAVLEQASIYLYISAFGLPGMLVAQAATGLVRGLQNARTPLVVALAGAIANVPLNALLIFGLGWGIAGSAAGTIVCETGMTLALLVVVVRGARAQGVGLAPQLRSVASTGREATPMFVRTLSLRIVMLTATLLATRLGAVQLAAHQLTLTVFTLFSLALDALAIAGQALAGRHLGAADAPAVRAVTSRLIRWGVGGGFVTGALVLLVSYLAPALFTPDPAVQENLRVALWVLMVAQPVAGYVFVLDGVLMGAGDAPYLAKAGIVTMLVVLPVAGIVAASHLTGQAALAAVWATCMLLFLVARAVTLGLRVRTDAWMRLGAAR